MNDALLLLFHKLKDQLTVIHGAAEESRLDLIKKAAIEAAKTVGKIERWIADCRS